MIILTVDYFYAFMKNILLSILLLFSLGLIGQSEIDRFDAANSAYADKDYNKAYELYMALIDEGNSSSELFYNFANTAYKQNKLAQAILFYERADLLNPSNKRINQNLAIARESVDTEILEIPEFLPIRIWKSFAGIISPLGWLVVQVIIAAIFLFGMYKWRIGYSQKDKMRGFLMVLVFGLLFLIALLASRTSNDQLFNRSVGIVMTDTILKSAPDNRSDDLKNLSDGVKIKVVDSIDNWYKVQLMNKEEGWLESKHIEMI